MISNYILIFCSGFTFAVGSINLAIGILKPKDRSYLYFGILSLFASAFLFNQVSTISLSTSSNISESFSIFLAIVFYTMFIWFIGEYTGYKKRDLQISISAFAGILFFLYFLVVYSIISRQLWELVAHIAILSISIYGIIAGIKGINEIHKLWKLIYLILIVLLFFLTIIVAIQIVFGVNLIYDPVGFISPLDFFPVFFSIIVGAKMSHEIIRSYQLDKALENKERKWTSLMERVNLLVVELDLDGNIVYMNPYFNILTGYSIDEVIRENWFQLMLEDDTRSEIKDVFSQIIKGKEVLVYQNFIRLKNEVKKSIQWSILPLKNIEGVITGTLSIGTDVTEIETALEEIKQLKSQLEKENLLLRESLHGKDYEGEIRGKSDSLKYALKRTIQVSATDSTVLLEGETGVGKELFANLIHRKSARYHKPFIKVNCSAIPKELIESEFFGHEKGAFTGALKTRQGRFELADKGTIFLDEVGEIPIELQAKLLRVLQSGEFERIGSEKTQKVDVRIIAATNKNLETESSAGRFRQDLFYRLNVYPITIPPLRHRKEDIPILVRHFVEKIGRKIGKKIKDISKADLTKLRNYSWPGNVRELENIIERSIINSPGDTLIIDHSQLKTISNGMMNAEKENNSKNLSDSQKSHILKVLEECQWKINGKNGAAQKLGIPPSTLRSKMKKLEIRRPVNYND